MWMNIWLLKKHYEQYDKKTAVGFLRDKMRPAQQAAYLLYVAVSTLIDWDSCFDSDYQRIKVIENRGLASVVTPELVMQIVKRVLLLKDENRKIQIVQFTQDLLKNGIDLSEKTVKEILKVS